MSAIGSGFWFCAVVIMGVLVIPDAFAVEGPLLDPDDEPLDLRPQIALPKKPQPVAKKQAVVAPKPKPPTAPPKVEPAQVPPQTLSPQALPHPTPVEKTIVPAAIKPASSEQAKPPFDELVVAQYCTSLSAVASDGRLAWQAKRLEEAEAKLGSRIAELEAKRAEAVEWVKRREDMMRKAEESVVSIYSKMKAEAVAAQFSAMDETGAAAILAKLNPRMASTVLNEIDPSRAARIAAEMAGVGPRREATRELPRVSP